MSLHFGLSLMALVTRRGQSAHVVSYRDFCVPAESAPSGKIAPCLAKEVGESQTRLIHLKMMHRVALGSVSFFIPPPAFFFFYLN